MNTPRHMLNVLRLAVALLFASALMSRCASMMTPTGGPRDSLPPVIVNMTPDNFATCSTESAGKNQMKLFDTESAL